MIRFRVSEGAQGRLLSLYMPVYAQKYERRPYAVITKRYTKTIIAIAMCIIATISNANAESICIDTFANATVEDNINRVNPKVVDESTIVDAVLGSETTAVVLFSSLKQESTYYSAIFVTLKYLYPNAKFFYYRVLDGLNENKSNDTVKINNKLNSLPAIMVSPRKGSKRGPTVVLSASIDSRQSLDAFLILFVHTISSQIAIINAE